MSRISIPVRVIGPGSQTEDDAPQLLQFPHETVAFAVRHPPEDASAGALREARDALAVFHASLERWNASDATVTPTLDVLRLSEPARTVLNEVLGEGEVAIQVMGTDAMRIQETVFTGLWRICTIDRLGNLAADRLEAAAVPETALLAARNAAGSRLLPVAIPPGAMNSPALLREIDAHLCARDPRAPAHVLNLTLLPLTPDDHLVLERALPVGPVAMISRGFGNCRITSTGARDVWRVQYFNSMNTLILNTIEIVQVPDVALAAKEDLEDTCNRLGELMAWMSESSA